MKHQHTISVLVENKFGVLARVAGLFSGRGYNIESLTVSTTQKSKISRMTIVTSGDDAIIEQIDKQLNKLIDVIKVTDMSGGEFIERELALVKVAAKRQDRQEIIQIAEVCGGRIVSVHQDELGIEISGTSEEIENFAKLVGDFGIIDFARSGRVAIAKARGTAEDVNSL